MIKILRAVSDDLPLILELQKTAYESEAILYEDWTLPALTQSKQSIAEEFGKSVFLKALAGESIVGSVRAFEQNGKCEIGRLIVHPTCQRQGIGWRLMQEIEALFPTANQFELFTGSKSLQNIRLYERLGYVSDRMEQLSATISIVYMTKPGRVLSQ